MKFMNSKTEKKNGSCDIMAVTTRGEKYILYRNKIFICLLFLCFVLPLLTPSAAAAGMVRHKVMEVIGQDNPSVDLNAIQNAVDGSNLVMLKGIFDIGSEGSVTLTKNVSIFGDMSNNERPATVIKGGTESFYADDPEIKIKISQIRFDGATFCAIRVRQCESVSITKNEFVNAIAGENYGEQGDLYYDAVGAIIGGRRTEFQNSRNIYCSNVTISDNYFDMGEYDENGELVYRDFLVKPTTSRAVRLYHCVLKRANITGNKVVNHNRIAFDCLDAAGTADHAAIIRIKRNDIETGPYAARGGWSSTEVVGSSYAMHCIGGYSLPEADNVIFRIKDNKIKTYSTNANSYNIGIYMFPATSNSLVANNTFELGQNTACGVAVFWLGALSSPIENQPHDNVIRNNKFSGTVTPVVIPPPSGAGEFVVISGAGVLLFSTNNNAVLNNDFTELVPVPKVMGTNVLPAAHVFLTGALHAANVYPAIENYISGSHGVVIDMTDDLTTPEYDGLNTYKGGLTVNVFATPIGE